MSTTNGRLNMSSQAILSYRFRRQMSHLTEENDQKQAIIDAQREDIEKLREQLKQAQKDIDLVALMRASRIAPHDDAESSSITLGTREEDEQVNVKDQGFEGDSHIQGDKAQDGDAQDTLGGAAADATESLHAEPEQDTGSDNEDEEYPLPLVDDDGTPRCTVCAWEVVDGLCQSCWRKYSARTDDTTEENAFRSVSTDYHVVQPARRTGQRGATPLLDIDETRFFQTQIPKPYALYEDEYRALLQRGATRQMCERFHLEFSESHGIVAWADDYIFEEFSGPGMHTGDKWKLYLGRAVTLESSDPDGKTFIEEFLEETVLYPAQVSDAWPKYVYQTVLESPGIWATGPVNPDGDDTTEDVFEQEGNELNWQDNLNGIMDKIHDEIDRATDGLPMDPAPVQNVYESTDEESDEEPDNEPVLVKHKDTVEDDEEDDDDDELKEDRAASIHAAEPDQEFDPDSVYVTSSSESDFESEAYLSSSDESD